uniref:STAS domain-containing protein n=1 Tax=Eucampia antarctica TaxID=49252 RepID=A0A7S2W1I0_9STRA
MAIAVGVGVVLSALVFAWDAGTKLSLQSQISEDGNIIYYTVQGPLYFGSVKPFMDLFPTIIDEETHPKEVVVLLENMEVYDWSGMMALKKLHERFDGYGCTVKFEKLTPSSHSLLVKSKDMFEEINIFMVENVDVQNDPLIEHSKIKSDAHF